jgi:hypothetical protein
LVSPARALDPPSAKPAQTDSCKKRWRHKLLPTLTTLRSSGRKSPVSMGILSSVMRCDQR